MLYMSLNPRSTTLHMSSNELIAGAVGYEAVHLWEKKRERDGEEDLSTSKKLIAEFAASEVSV